MVLKLHSHYKTNPNPDQDHNANPNPSYTTSNYMWTFPVIENCLGNKIYHTRAIMTQNCAYIDFTNSITMASMAGTIANCDSKNIQSRYLLKCQFMYMTTVCVLQHLSYKCMTSYNNVTSCGEVQCCTSSATNTGSQ